MTTTSREPRPAMPSDMDWDIDAIVAELRSVRNASLVARQRLGKPAKLPLRKRIASIVDGLSTALFPNRLSSRELVSESVDCFVGHTLDESLRELVHQVLHELQFVSGHHHAGGVQRAQAIAIVRAFTGRLAGIRALLETDIVAAYEGDPAARSIDEVLVCYPGITAITHHRLAHALHELAHHSWRGLLPRSRTP